MFQPKDDQQEEDIPALAKQAIQDAFNAALASGRSVLVTQDDLVYEVFPDGTKQVVTQLAPRMRIDPGIVRALPQ